MTERPRFALYGFWRTSATYRVRVALNLKGLVAEERNVNMDAGEQLGEAFRKINPLGAIPALIDLAEDQPHAAMTQSLAILEFLDEIAPTPPLLPPDPHGRARVRSIAAMLAADTHPLITPRVRKYLTANAGFDDAAWRAWLMQWFGTGLRAVEQRLASESATGTYCHGQAITIADICLASILAMLRVLKVEITDIPTITRIFAACEQHEAFARADPYRQAGAPAA